MSDIRPIEDFPGYWIDDEGNVWTGLSSVRKKSGRGFYKKISDKPERKLNPGITKGYKHVSLYRNSKRYIRRVHKLVLDTFHGPKPFDDAICRHLDGDPSNNKPENLAWGTHKENAQDSLEHGVYPIGERNSASKLTELDVVEIRQTSYYKGLFNDLAERYNVNSQTISRAYYGEQWSHLPAANEYYISEDVIRDIISSEPCLGVNQHFADKYGLSLPTIISIRTGKTNAHIAPEIPRWEPRAGYKLSDSQVRDIRLRENYRGLIRDLAKEFDVNRMTIRSIRNGKSYQHVK